MAIAELAVTQNERAWEQRELEALIDIEGMSRYARASKNAHSSHEVLFSRRIRDERLYLRLGYDTFRDYLDQRERSPMSYHEFNKRDKLLDELGEEHFDFLNGCGLFPARQQKLIGRIRTEGDEYVITRADGTEERFAKTDAATAKRLLPTIIEEYRDLEKEKQRNDELLAKQSEQLTQGQKDYDELKRKLVEAQQAHGLSVPETDEDLTEFLAMMEVAHRAKAKLANLNPEKKSAIGKLILKAIGQMSLDFSEVLDLVSKEENALARAAIDEE